MRQVNAFIERWEEAGDEKSDTQKFWLELMRDVLGPSCPEQFIQFEKRVALEHVSFIDAYIPSTRTVIEQKNHDVKFDKPITQSDGSTLTPFQQAKRYSDWLPDSERARWIVVCNFQQFMIYDMEQPKADPETIELANLNRDWQKLLFLVDVNGTKPKDIHEVDLSIKAGELVGKLYDNLLERYINPDDKDSQRSLNVFCVRVVFLLYAEDSGLFGKAQFHDYLKARKNVARDSLRRLFEVLNQQENERDPYLDADLKAFPYVNGGLFADNNIELPQLDGEPLRIILEDMSESFNWSGISPTIFGAVFESTLNPQTRHSGGMHYTSIENIHKVIDPLFLDELSTDLDAIMKSPLSRSRTQKLRVFQKRLGKLIFFDPACGSGNFLTETYLSLRRLENKIVAELTRGQISFAFSKQEAPVQVSISQFYGIEINDFAVSVARTALWIAETQMLNETKAIVQVYEDVLPLKNYDNITEANALTLDWSEVVKPSKVNFIMGNPPFIGRRYRTKEQHEEVSKFFEYKDIDYVACWYMIAANYIQGTNIECAFVSTNSICQGEQVLPLWKPLFQDKKIYINFVYETFRWFNEAKTKAAVHCVVIGFSCVERSQKIIFDAENCKHYVQHINAYLIDAVDVFIGIRSKPLCDVPAMKNGNVPLDGDALKIEAEDLPIFGSFPYIKRLMGGRELLHNEKRYVLWLVGVPPNEIRKNAKVIERVKLCRDNRLKMQDKGTQKLAETPTTFRDTNNPEKYIALPMVSSETRQYIPMAYLNSDVIPTNQIQTIPNATIYHFGVLMSRVHMAWMRIVAGRLKSDYRYSKDIVYNNFVWPNPTEKQKSKIESTGQMILDVRKKFPDDSLADLYDPLTMPEELLRAHKANDAAVCEAYGWSYDISEYDIVKKLFGLYSNFTG